MGQKSAAYSVFCFLRISTYGKTGRKRNTSETEQKKKRGGEEEQI